MLRLVLILGYIAVTVYAIADAAQHREPRPYGLPKWLWIAVIILLPYVGAIAWFVVKFLGHEDDSTQRGPTAPDDDPEYLRWLEEQQRRKSRDDKDR